MRKSRSHITKIERNKGLGRRIIIQRNAVHSQLPRADYSQVRSITAHGYQATDTIQVLNAFELVGFNQKNQWIVLPLVYAGECCEN